MKLFLCTFVCATVVDVASAQVPFHRTYFGGNAADRVQGVAVDRHGRVYVTGHTDSTNLQALLPASPNAFDKTWNGELDAYVAVLSADLQNVLRWTLLGGSLEDRGYAIEILPNDEVIVVGLTESSDFPSTTGVAHHGGVDAFVTRFSPDLSQVLMSTVFGGTGDENPRGSFCVGPTGAVIIAGHTTSLDLPTAANVFQPQHAPISGVDDWDGFVAKIALNGSVVWTTYLGGSNNDAGHSGVRLHPDGSIYVAGMTNSPDFPVTPGAYQTQYQGNGVNAGSYQGDGFVARLKANGTTLIFSTFLGGSEGDYVAVNDGLEVDSSGNPVVIGGTRSIDFPVTAGAFDTRNEFFLIGQPDVFVSVLSSDGANLLTSTFLGGEQFEEPSGLVLDDGDAVYLSGNTGAANFPVTLDANQKFYSGGLDAFITKLSPDLSHLVYSSYIGGHGVVGNGDRGRGLALLQTGEVVIGGDTDSHDLPMPTYTFADQYNGGLDDGFVSVEPLSSSYAFGVGKLNSLGLVPAISMVGAPSVQTGNFELQVANAVPLRNGVFAYGVSLVANPYFGGTFYMGNPVQRAMRVPTDAAGTASATLAITPDMLGDTRIYQYWYRDPAHPDNTHVGLSNAFKVTFVP